MNTVWTAPSTSTALTHRPKWVRSPNGLLAGVCEGLGQSFGISPWLLRGLWLLSVCALGTGALLYVILAFCLPRADRLADAERKRVLGVCHAISQRSGIDVGAVRALAVMLAIASFGATVVGYVVLYFVMPDGRDRLVY
jgi:phage shock protein PspC (stress-responsive transcriptional regulator)